MENGKALKGVGLGTLRPQGHCLAALLQTAIILARQDTASSPHETREPQPEPASSIIGIYSGQL
jgi:hypothetical protein